MSVGEKIAAASNRFYLRVRHPEAFRAAAEPGTAHDFAALAGHKYCLLTTFRRDGTPVPTPVWFGVGEGRLYVRTEAAVGKVKRIRNDPRALIAPSTVRGKPKGPAVAGKARVLPKEEWPHAEAALAAAYGVSRKIYEGVLGGPEEMGTYIEISPT